MCDFFGGDSGPNPRVIGAAISRIRAAQQAALAPRDSEPARQASESRLRRLLSGRGVGSFLMQPQLSPAQVGVRTLLGA